MAYSRNTEHLWLIVENQWSSGTIPQAISYKLLFHGDSYWFNTVKNE